MVAIGSFHRDDLEGFLDERVAEEDAPKTIMGGVPADLFMPVKQEFSKCRLKLSAALDSLKEAE